MVQFPAISVLSFFSYKKILNVVLPWVKRLRHPHNVKLRDKTRHYVDNAVRVFPGHLKPTGVWEKPRIPPGP